MSKLQPFAKAVAPAFLTLVGAAAYSLSNGHFDKTSAVVAGVGLIGAAITFFVPNAAPEVQAIEGLLPDPEHMLSPEQPVQAVADNNVQPQPAPTPPTPPVPPPAAPAAPTVPPTPPAAA